MRRAVALTVALFGAAGGPAVVAGAAPPVHGLRPICLADIAVRLASASAAGDVHEATVIVSRTAGAPCVVANFPQPALASPAGRPMALRAGRLSLAQSVTIGAGTTAAFLLRYTTAPAPASEAADGATPAPACNVAVLVNGVQANGPPIALGPCTALTAIEVSSFGGGTAPPDDAAAPPAATKLACRPQDLELRDAGADPGSDPTRETYALQNVGLGACRLSGGVGVQLLDARGTPIPLRAAPRIVMATLLTLPRGHDASFTVAYAVGGPNGEQRCIVAQTIAVTIPQQPTPITAPTHVAPCPPATGAGMRISNLRLGLPLPSATRL